MFLRQLWQLPTQNNTFKTDIKTDIYRRHFFLWSWWDPLNAVEMQPQLPKKSKEFPPFEPRFSMAFGSLRTT